MAPEHSLSDTNTCDHDWRVQPDVVLMSDPPQERLVCATCGAISSRTVPGYVAPSSDPRDWPKADE